MVSGGTVYVWSGGISEKVDADSLTSRKPDVDSGTVFCTQTVPSVFCTQTARGFVTSELLISRIASNKCRTITYLFDN